MRNGGLELVWDIPEPGDTIGDKYIVEASCGRGEVTAVLSAIQPELDRRVAIKVLLPEWAAEPEAVERFLRSGRNATRIHGEHVVRVFDVGLLEGGAPYLVLEYLDGHNLEEVVGHWGSIPVSTAIDWILQAGEAVAEAHACGVVHRDLSPANLFLTRRSDGTACIKVIDFGLSRWNGLAREIDPKFGRRADRPADVLPSPRYKAPEQLQAACGADERADLWALGAVLHDLITGRPPFAGESLPEICATVLSQPPPRISSVRPNVPAEVERAVLRCLEKDPNARFRTVAEVARALVAFGTTEARTSYERISRVVGAPDAGLDQSTPLTSWHDDDEVAPAEVPALPWPSDPSLGELETRRILLGAPAQARVMLGAFLLLGGVGAGLFMVMVNSVHGEPVPTAGVTAPAPNANVRAALPPLTVLAPTPPEGVATARSANVPLPRPAGSSEPHPSSEGSGPRRNQVP